MARTDQLTISLGPEKSELMTSLKRLALDLDFPGRDGDGSMSQLMIHLARAYDADSHNTALLINAAFQIAGGADVDETLDSL
jgi:hypothetical protein